MASLLSLSLPKPNIIKACSSSSSSTAPAPSDTLNDKFSRKGIKFSELSDNTTVVDLTVRNGSSLRLRIPEAHVSSYKPKVYWKDDGFEEVLYTTTLPSSPSSVKGGIGLVLNDASENSPKNGMSILSGCEWTVQHVHSDAIDTLQVELGCTSGGLEIIYVVTLYPLSMATAVIVKNKGKKAVSLKSAILSHFKFKKRHKSAIQGLKGCTYCSHPPLSSPFELLSPSEAVKPETSSAGLFTFGFSEPVHAPGVWAEQDVPFTILRDRISRVYATPPQERLKEFYNTPPSKYETLDQGRELFYRVIKLGFEDIYVSSPGSSSEKFGSEYFACTGPASMLVPVVIEPGESWRGAQMIEHDNL